MENSCKICKQPLGEAFETMQLQAGGRIIGLVHTEPCGRVVGENTALLGMIAYKGTRALLAAKAPKVLSVLDFIAAARRSVRGEVPAKE